MFIKSILVLVLINSVVPDNGFRCDYAYSDDARGWLKFHRFPTEWLDAKLRCTLEGARLASPTRETYKSMMMLMQNFTTDSIFTGINAIIRRGYFTTLEGVPAEHRNVLQAWAQGEPDNLDGNEQCVSLDSSGYLSDVDCNMMLPYVCYRRKTGNEIVSHCGTIDNEYEYESQIQSCHKIHTEARNFSEAFMTCQAEGGHLAIVNSDREAGVIRRLIDRYTPENKNDLEYFFLGFHDDWYKDRKFMTIEDETLEGAGGYFAPGQPDNNDVLGEHCGCINRGTTQLHDIRCSIKTGFVCEIDPSTLNYC